MKRLLTLLLLVACVAAGPVGPVRAQQQVLNLQDADIRAFIQDVARATGQTFIIDPRVQGRVSVASQEPLSRSELFEVMLSTLRANGLVAVPTGSGAYRIAPEEGAAQQPATAGAGFATQVFRLGALDAASAAEVIKPLVGRQGLVLPSRRGNLLVVADYADNLRRIRSLLNQVDQDRALTETVTLRSSSAREIGGVINELPKAPGDDPGARNGLVSVVVVESSNSLILRAANPARAQLVRTLVAKLDRAPEQGSNGDAGNIYVVYLKNADAVKLATTLRAAMSSDARGGAGNTAGGANAFATTGAAQQQPTSLNQNQQGLGGGLSSAATAPLNNNNQPSTGGQIQADPTTNSLIITASEPQYRQLRAVIDRLDGRRAQVMVESLIIEVNANKAAEFGIQWQTAIGATGAVGTNSSLAGANIFNLSSATSSTGVAQQPSSGFNIGLGTTIAGGNVLGLVARALQSNGEGNVLSTPNLLTLDNEEAKIIIGQNVPFVTGQYASTNGNSSTVNPFTTVERKDVGLTLRVKPQINENGTIKMQIFQEVSSVDQSTRADVNGPTTNKRSIESNVLVENGSIVMLGGLLQDEYSGGTEKVPLLGDVPILGNLFKSEVRSRKKTNLMVFLRPVVMRDGQSTNAFAVDRYDAIRTMQQTTQPENSFVLRGVDESAVLPPLPESSDGDRRIEGTRLIPPPLAPASSQLGSSPLRGTLPPTADPASRRELP